MRVPFLTVGVVAVLTVSAVAAPMARAAAEEQFAVQHHAVSTRSADAQAAFDEGLTLLYSFNRVAARRSFERAARIDPHLAMAYWGVAMATAANINFGSDPKQLAIGSRALRTAATVERFAKVPERAYIAALRQRYARGAEAYAAQMRSLYRRYPADADAATLYAQSLMELRPWMLYDASGAPVPRTPEIVSVLTSTLRRHPEHIGANHLCIHALEAAASPVSGRPCADRLAAMRFGPAAEHLTHMPSHTYARVGALRLAAYSNEAAVRAGAAYLRAHPDDTESAAYQDHNYMFLQYGYATEGRFEKALAAARVLQKDGMETPLLFTYVRFHRWNDVAATAKPAANENEPVRLPVWHFARGMAFAALGKTDAARRELAAVQLAPKYARVASSPGNYQAPTTVVQMARTVLSARIDAADGKSARAIAQYRRAVALQDGFLYVEPPDWYAPAREALGAMLLMRGDANGAATVFRADLRRNPGNPRSLDGLRRALRKETARRSWDLV